MKKFLALTVLVILTLALAAGCAAAPGEQPAETPAETPAEPVVLKIGASITPHAEILNQVVEDLAGEGITLEVIDRKSTRLNSSHRT